jgi:hypothetical protein
VEGDRARPQGRCSAGPGASLGTRRLSRAASPGRYRATQARRRNTSPR